MGLSNYQVQKFKPIAPLVPPATGDAGTPDVPSTGAKVEPTSYSCELALQIRC